MSHLPILLQVHIYSPHVSHTDDFHFINTILYESAEISCKFYVLDYINFFVFVFRGRATVLMRRTGLTIPRRKPVIQYRLFRNKKTV